MPPHLDARVLFRAMEVYAEVLLQHRDELDSLNVFPVPDGDTGTNLWLTQTAVVGAIDPGMTLPDLGAAISQASLMGARGNSGVILSQVLRGLCRSMPAGGAASGSDVARAVSTASRDADEAVARPREGTMLSVLRHVAGAATQAAAAQDDGVPAVLDAMVRAARASLARTTDQLPELRDARVVDAGAKGIVLLVESLQAALVGTAVDDPVGPFGPVGRIESAATSEPVAFAFEVQYLLEAPSEALPALRRDLAEVGDSVVVVGGGGLYHVHVHTDQPDRAMAIGRAAGTPRTALVANLQDQVAACVGGQARAVRVAEPASVMVAVAEGEGVARLFGSLGATVVRGGPGSMPVLADLVVAIDSAPVDVVVVVPTHRAVEPVAREAAATAAREAVVLATTSVPAGLAAATAFNPMVPIEENLAAMGEAAAATAAGEVVRVEPAAGWGSGSGSPPAWVGLVEGREVVAAERAEVCAVDLARRLATEGSEVLTLVVGADPTGEDRDLVVKALSTALPSLRVDAFDGGQAGADYLMGVE